MSIVYSPLFERSAVLVRNLTEATRLLSWIQQQLVDVSWIASTQRDALVRLAHFSTRIEGNPLTLPEVEALAAGKNVFVEERSKREVLNYFAALRWIGSSGGTKMTEAALLSLHRILTAGLLSKFEVGIYKTKPNAVFGNGRIVYKPPPPEAAPILTRSLLHWLNSSKTMEEHPVVTAAIAHHRLVSIHPFMDGNGRIARSLETWILVHRDFDTHHLFALDEFFDHDRNRYYREIQRVRDHGDVLTSWLEYVSEGILETLNRTQRRIQGLGKLKPATRIVLMPKQERLLQLLVHSPRLGGGELARSLSITRSHLSKILRPLLDAGLVHKDGSTKSAFYGLHRGGIESALRP